jgi:hypothetical protein
MRTHPILLIALATVFLFWPATGYAKRKAPKPVPPIVWQGVEYRAPLDAEDVGIIQAFDLASGRRLWETKVYHVWIIPGMEPDVQWVFISGMQIQDGKLLVENERGKTFLLNLKTGRVEGILRFRTLWFLLASSAGLLIFFTWNRRRRRWHLR